ncbi:hypothetical protein GGS24DRAFT_517201 [Hypoxylon argillaceum]|nr:hypothetical protein GGS24DRAFT_517201 [Hypoxylon argillaceum]
MDSQPQQSRPRGFPLELLEMVVDELQTPAALLNLGCASSTMDCIIVSSKPSLLYLKDARYHKRLISDPVFKREQHPPTLPSLVHAIQSESLDKIRTVLTIFQVESSPVLDEAWDTDIFPTAVEAAITAHRLEVVKLLIESGCGLVVGDRRGKISNIEETYEHFYSDVGQEPWNPMILRSGMDHFRGRSRAFVLACIQNQEDIAMYLTRNVFVSERYFLWVAVVTGIKRILNYFTSLGLLNLQDPLIPLTLKFALETDSIDWLSTNLTRLRARGGRLPAGSLDELIRAIVEKEYWDFAALALDILSSNAMMAIWDVAATAASTDAGLPVTTKFIAFLCHQGFLDRRLDSQAATYEPGNDWSLVGSPRRMRKIRESLEHYVERSKLENLQEIEKLLFEASMGNGGLSFRTFRSIVALRGEYAMKYLASIIDNNKATELAGLLPWNASQKYYGSCERQGCYSLHNSLEKGSELLSRAIMAESWDTAFVLAQFGANLYKVNQAVKDYLLLRLGSLEYPEGKSFASHLASVYREPKARSKIFESQQPESFLDQLATLFRLCLGDQEILSRIAEIESLE